MATTPPPRAARRMLMTSSLLYLIVLAACGGGSGDGAEGRRESPRPTGAQTNDPQLNQGRSVYVSSCARCHGAQGQGGIGPRLAGRVANRYPNIEDQKAVVRQGRGLMPSFATSLSEDEIDAVVRYEREVL